ncbi:hypothetical protein [Aquimarina sp. RZ0]|uniref:hypothetical protein n=1 Tax=Aquimarina sp. RZ0 TaxID=2607730 RepID=UPI0011F37664|nr:hypothetical protein [Aquimarina sp. RZ0]KAA1247986.1 hypothetical protein F0000_01840 [Aquimarina sp. RZ0]
MRKIFFLIIFLAICKTSFGQQVLELKQKNKKIEALIPENWNVIAMDKDGDLNNDGINDLVFIAKKEDINNFITDSEIGTDSLDINPKILGVYFKDKSGCYEKKLQHNTFIFLNKEPTREEPFQSLDIINGELKLEFQEFYNAGSWYVNDEAYSFKYIEGSFKLVKYVNSSMHRASMDFKEEVTDYIKGTIFVTKETFNEEKENPITTSDTINFAPKKLKSLKELKIPFLFE